MSQLSQLIKTKYPQYANTPDDQLEKMVLAKYPQYQSMVSQPSVGGFAGNVLKSGGRFIGDTVSGLANVFNPDMEKNTVANLAKLGGDTIGAAGDLFSGNEVSQDNRARMLVDFYKSRYGKDLGKTLYEDPVGVLGDLSVLLGGAGLVAKGAGAVGTANKLAKLSRITDPLAAVNKVGGATINKGLGGVSKKLAETGKKLPLAGLGNPAEQAKMMERYGVSMEDLMQKYNMYDRSPTTAQNVSSSIGKQYGDVIRNSGKTFELKGIVKAIDDKIGELQSGAGKYSDSNLSAIDELQRQKSNLLQYTSEVGLQPSSVAKPKLKPTYSVNKQLIFEGRGLTDELKQYNSNKLSQSEANKFIRTTDFGIPDSSLQKLKRRLQSRTFQEGDLDSLYKQGNSVWQDIEDIMANRTDLKTVDEVVSAVLDRPTIKSTQPSYSRMTQPEISKKVGAIGEYSKNIDNNFSEWQNSLISEYGALTPEEFSQLTQSRGINAGNLLDYRQALDKDIPQSAFNLDAKQSGRVQGLKTTRDILKGSLDSISDEVGQLGREYGASKKATKIFERASRRADNRKLISPGKVWTSGLGGFVGGLPGAVAGYAAETIASDPRFLKFASQAMTGTARGIDKAQSSQLLRSGKKAGGKIFTTGKYLRLINQGESGRTEQKSQVQGGQPQVPVSTMPQKQLSTISSSSPSVSKPIIKAPKVGANPFQSVKKVKKGLFN